jgi:hypothetical protein
MYELLSIQEGYNGKKWYVIGNTSTFFQAWPVETWSSMEQAQISIDKHNKTSQNNSPMGDFAEKQGDDLNA